MSSLDLGFSLRVAISMVFLAAGVLKLRATARQEMMELIRVIGLAHESARARLLVVAIAVMEMLLSVWLLSGFASRLGLAAAAATFVLFLIVLTVALKRGFTGSCSCFGPISGRLNASAICFDVVLLGIVVAAIMANSGDKGLVDAKASDLVFSVGLLVWLSGVKALLQQVGDVRLLLAGQRGYSSGYDG